MNEENAALGWQDIAVTALAVFLLVVTGCIAGFTLWRQELTPPQVTILGAGDRLSLLVSDGPARLILATGDDPINYENALARIRPPFARRVDVLLVAGSGQSLLAPLAARGDPHLRTSFALAPLASSPEAAALGPLPAFTSPQTVQLGPSLTVTVETILPFGAEEGDFPAWRATIARGESTVVVLSNGAAAALFPPMLPASVLVVSGDDPAAAWDAATGVAVVANAEAITGPEMRQALSDLARPPSWAFLVFPGEALRIRFVPGGVEIPSDSAQPIVATPQPSPAAPAE